jgi:hypothetical protein
MSSCDTSVIGATRFRRTAGFRVDGAFEDFDSVRFAGMVLYDPFQRTNGRLPVRSFRPRLFLFG